MYRNNLYNKIHNSPHQADPIYKEPYVTEELVSEYKADTGKSMTINVQHCDSLHTGSKSNPSIEIQISA